MGPYFGDMATVVVGVTVPVTDIERRVRVNHIYAKLDANYWVPAQADPRQFGPEINVEEYSMFKRQGSVDEVNPENKEKSTGAFLGEMEAEQGQVKREMEGGGNGSS